VGKEVFKEKVKIQKKFKIRYNRNGDTMNNTTKLVTLVILDGFGIAPDGPATAVSLARKPFYDSLIKKYPHAQLEASGHEVGLPGGQMGNSEVGHLTIGSGRVISQSLDRINIAIEDQSFFQLPALLQMIEHVKTNHSQLHLMGLVSAGGVHSQMEHFQALYDLCKTHEITDQVWLHVFLDGRDTKTDSGYGYVKQLVDYGFQIADVSGRYYPMDRDNNYDRIQRGYDIMTQESKTVTPALKGIKKSYQNGITDEFVEPFKCDNRGTIRDNDALMMVNFRQDRAIRISTAFSNPTGLDAIYVDGKPHLKAIEFKNLLFVSMMFYADSVKGLVTFPQIPITELLGEIISKKGLKQLRIAETEKYNHVTRFFDGAIDVEYPNEKRILVPSPSVATYDLQPEMSAYEVADKAQKEILENDYSLVVLNFANPDMVGHTGKIDAAVKAIEAVDINLGKVVTATLLKKGVCIIIADHGNAEVMVDAKGIVHTAHTTNPVPIIITLNGIKIAAEGGLKDIAPTILALLNIKQPKVMTGISLIQE
jgi:2,3-bisphosphoglycerate-independent phosphoglycerate mutase